MKVIQKPVAYSLIQVGFKRLSMPGIKLDCPNVQNEREDHLGTES